MYIHAKLAHFELYIFMIIIVLFFLVFFLLLIAFRAGDDNIL